MDAIVCMVGDSLTALTQGMGFRGLGVPESFVTPTNKFYAANLQYGFTASATCRNEWRKIYTSGSGTTIACNYAISGATIDDFVTNTAWRNDVDALAAAGPLQRRKILYMAFGANIGATSSTAELFLSTMQSLIASQKAAGWDDIILQSICSRTDVAWGVTGTKNTDYAQPINSQYLDYSWQTTHGVTISDVAQHEELGPWDRSLNVVALPSNDLTWFSDKIHPTLAAVAIAGPTMNDAINARLTASGCTAIPYSP
jgi:hypothetical protein